MNKYILILFLFFFAFASKGSNNIESVKDSLSEYSGADKAKALYKIGEYYYFNNTDSALHYFGSALTEYENINDEKEMAKSYCVLGGIYTDIGLFDTAVALIFKTIEWGEENNDELAFYAYFELANTYDKMRQSAKAQKYYRKAISGDHLKSKLAAFTNLGLLYLEEKKYDSANFYFNAGLKEYYKLDTSLHINKYNIAAIYLNLSAVDFGEGNYEKGILRLNESSRIFNEIGSYQRLAKVFLNLGKGYGKLQKAELSSKYFLKAKEIADSLQNVVIQEEVYSWLTDYYRKKGDFENALISMETYEMAHNNLMVMGYKSTIAEMEVKYSIKEKNYLISDLKREKQNMFIVSMFIIFGLLLLSLLVILFINGHRLKLKSTKNLAEAKAHYTKLQHENALDEFERMKLSLQEKSAFIEELETEIKKLSIVDEQQNIEEKIKLLRRTRILTNADWKNYMHVFNEIYPLFYNNVKNIEELTIGDKRQLIFLKLGLKRKEVAYLMGITLDGIKRARQRLSKKLGLSDSSELAKYIEEL